MEFMNGVRRISVFRLGRIAAVIILGLCLVISGALAEARMMPKASPKQKISGRYIVVLRDSAGCRILFTSEGEEIKQGDNAATRLQ